MKKFIAVIGSMVSLAAAQASMASGTIIVGNSLPPINVSCSCEHYGSTLDGICDVWISGINTPAAQQWLNTTTVTYSWSTYGAAEMPFGYLPEQNNAYYSVPYVGPGGGLISTVRFEHLTQETDPGFPYSGIFEFGPDACGNGTVGGWGG